MKKFQRLVLLFLVGSLTLVSCNKDNDKEASIEGKWLYSKEGTIVNGQELLVDYQHTSGCNKDYTEIIAGGSVKDVYYESNGNGGCDQITDTGSWSRNGNTISATFSGYTNTGEILELSDTTLKIKFVDPDDGSISITVSTRI